MRLLPLIPLTVLLIAAAGALACSAAGWNPHHHEMIVAGMISFAGASAGILFPLLVRNSTQSTVSQAGLGATVIQMLTTLGLAAMAMMAHGITDLRVFSFWLLAYYWALLVVIVTITVSFVKNAKPDEHIAIARSATGQPSTGQSAPTQSV